MTHNQCRRVGEIPRGFINVIDRGLAGLARNGLIVRLDGVRHPIEHLLDGSQAQRDLRPAHFFPVPGVALSSADAFATPVGQVMVDAAARERALTIAGTVVDDAAHAGEHSLEVHLPFIAAVLGPVPVLPLLVGRRGSTVLADVLDALWGGDETRIVVTTDLSHYHDDATAKAIDRETAEAIVARTTQLQPERACGAGAVLGLLEAARRHDLAVRLLDLRTSADTAGHPDRVVGYGAFTLS